MMFQQPFLCGSRVTTQYTLYPSVFSSNNNPGRCSFPANSSGHEMGWSTYTCFDFSNNSMIHLGLELNKQVSGSNERGVFSNTRDHSKCGASNVYSHRAEERVLEEEASQASEDGLPWKIFPGQAFPLGVSEVDNGINFAIFSQHATAVTLCLVLPERGNIGALDSGMIQLALDPHLNKTGDIWHICIEDWPRSNVLYGYRIDGPQDWGKGHRFDNSMVLIDPYAKLIEGRRYFGDTSMKLSKFLGTYDFDSLPFDWGENYKLPNIPEKNLVIYEMNVRAFTIDESSGLDHDIRGSYLGVIEKIPHLLELGINAVELLPIFEFDELEFQRRPNPRDHMINTWGYSTINFFAPMSRYASSGGGPVSASREFKQMVKALHCAGIEVILDVVYNHTNEADDEYPYTTSFRGIDNKVYYMLDKNGQLLNFSGCGNTLNCNHPVVMELILDSLRHWRMRTFKRWMKSQGIEWSDALDFTDSSEEGIAVRALCELKEGDVVANIPKESCLTIKTSGASEMIEAAGLGGNLGLAVAIMYERSLGKDSPWAGYLQLLPDQECVPIVWTLNEVNELLRGTELHKTVQEDKILIYEDWKEDILPILDVAPSKLNPKYFGIEQYFAAKSLINSRAFEIDDYHGFGMVPLADLFNHKTGAEDVHFTSSSSHYESNSDADGDYTNEEPLIQNSSIDDAELNTVLPGKSSGSELECSSATGDDNDPSILEMIVVKDVSIGSEVFNTYGLMGNAALLHRYGFTEQDNIYDIVNIDLELILKWSSSLFSGRYSRARLSLWRRLGYSACASQDSEYFEVSFNGEPQIELLILLYIMLLPEDAYYKFDLGSSMAGKFHASSKMTDLEHSILLNKTSDVNKKSLLTRNVCDALLSLADLRESFYGPNSIDDDVGALRRCSCIREKKLHHSLVLRISERKILEKLRSYAAQPFKRVKLKPDSVRKKFKKGHK